MHGSHIIGERLSNQHLADRLRHYCRNPRCRSKLQEPVGNPRNAFCCRGCYANYFRIRCFVCEQPFTRSNEAQFLCSRRKCRAEWRRDPEQFLGNWGGAPSAPRTPVKPGKSGGNGAARYPGSDFVIHPHKSAANTGIKTRPETGRAWRQIAGPPADPVSVRLATIGTDQIHRQEERQRALVERNSGAIIQRHHQPVNVLGGYQFPGAPTVDLRLFPEVSLSNAFGISQWEPCAHPASVPDIPAFLRRTPADPPPPTEQEGRRK
jgi:hypothetical protein